MIIRKLRTNINLVKNLFYFRALNYRRNETRENNKRENNNRPKNFSFLTRLGRIYESQGSSILWRIDFLRNCEKDEQGFHLTSKY